MRDKKSTRRDFLKVSATLPLAIGAGMTGVVHAAGADKKPEEAVKKEAQAGAASTLDSAQGPLPTRKLGKSGVEVSMLNIGGMMNALNPQYLDIAWANGIRYFDTADCYIGGKSEKYVAEWIAAHPDERKNLFLVTKDHPKTIDAIPDMVDKRLDACGTDYVDLFFIHGIGPRSYGKESLEWPKSDELKKVAESLKKSGKVKLFGFSCHDKQKAEYLQAAADGGFIDAIMVAFSPASPLSDDFQKSLDACAKAGVGLVCMKEMRPFAKAPKRNPEFDALGITTQQAALQAVWSDGRFASICSSMENVEQIKENSEAARKYKNPLSPENLKKLGDIASACSPTLCPNCDGRCARAAGNENLALDDISRYVTYYEQDGNIEAIEYYQALAAEARALRGTDLKAASEACLCKVDFERIAKSAEEYFG
jgi:aryl-alcohol dehydrogenase-like predicted oxidoreductase